MTIRILGFNLSHDSSACLVEDGRVRAALALERTTRIKRGVVPAHAYAAAMAALTRELLAGVQLRHADIDYWIATSTESRDARDERCLADTLGLVVPLERRLAMPHPGHHLAHASSAFYTSGFESAAAIVIDAYGSRIGTRRERESAFEFSAGAPPRLLLQNLREQDRIAGRLRDRQLWVPATLSGIGEIYRVVTLALGFNEAGTTYDDAGKTMGLAAYGRRLSAGHLFMTAGPDGLSFDGAADALVDLGLAIRHADGLRLMPRPPGAPLQQFHCDLAAQVQAEFEDACLHLVRDVLGRTRCHSLVLAGGCFLNSVLNARILRETGIERLSIFPASTDDGNAAGAALYAHHVLLGAETASGEQNRPMPHVFLGPPRLADCDVAALADRWRLPSRRHASKAALAEAAAAAIARGEIIGWFQDRAEFGPRSLGARSILCHPGIEGMKDRLNARVKFRESFRPFAASVLAEHAAAWFDMPARESPFMLLVCPAIASRSERISEVVHADGTCRIQTVGDDFPAPFRELLEAFEDATGLPLVLNTSFNLRGSPIVERPEEAVDCLYGSRLDRLFLGDHEIEAPNLAELMPLRSPAEEQLTVRDAPSEQRLLGSHHGTVKMVVAANGRSHRLDGLRLGLFDRANGTSTLRQIAREIGAEEFSLVDEALELRRHGLVHWAGLPTLPASHLPLPQYDPQTEAG